MRDHGEERVSSIPNEDKVQGEEKAKYCLRRSVYLLLESCFIEGN